MSKQKAGKLTGALRRALIQMPITGAWHKPMQKIETYDALEKLRCMPEPLVERDNLGQRGTVLFRLTKFGIKERENLR